MEDAFSVPFILSWPRSMKRHPDSGIREIFACRIRNPGKFCFWIPESCTLKFEKRLHESGFHLTIVIRNPSCTDKVWNPVPGIRNPARPGIQNPRLSWIPLPGANFQCWSIFVLLIFWRLPYCVKQRKLRKNFKKLAVSCGTKREFCLETVLACICWRLGCKNISLAMWWQGTDCNSNKGCEIYFWRIYQ